jgi:hypothetical protein
MRCFKVGGIRFLRIGRLQFSFCLCRRRPPRVRDLLADKATPWQAQVGAAFRDRPSALQRLAILSAETRPVAPLRPSLACLLALGFVQALTCVALYVAH